MSTDINHSAMPSLDSMWPFMGETKREKWAAQFMSAMLAHEDLKNWVDYGIVAREAVVAVIALEAALNEQP